MIIPGLGYILAQCFRHLRETTFTYDEPLEIYGLLSPSHRMRFNQRRSCEREVGKRIKPLTMKHAPHFLVLQFNTREPGHARKLSSHEQCLTIQNCPKFDRYARDRNFCFSFFGHFPYSASFFSNNACTKVQFDTEG